MILHYTFLIFWGHEGGEIDDVRLDGSGCNVFIYAGILADWYVVGGFDDE